MDTLARVIVAVVGTVVIGLALYLAIQWNTYHISNKPIVIWSSNPGAIATTTTATTTPDTLEAVGTIVFYVQQGKEVPYFFYQSKGKVISKALVFDENSLCVTSVEAPCDGTVNHVKALYGSGPVDITGVLESESLLVTRITAAPAVP